MSVASLVFCKTCEFATGILEKQGESAKGIGKGTTRELGWRNKTGTAHDFKP